MVLTTSNITEAIDLAFVDRADIKVGFGWVGGVVSWVGDWGWVRWLMIALSSQQQSSRQAIIRPPNPCDPTPHNNNNRPT